MRALFISDLHLSEHDAQTHARFLRFIAGPAQQADQLYILGDLFHQWLGDAQVTRDPYAGEVVRALRGLADTGVKIAMMVGNRDFMIGRTFCDAIGARSLVSPCVETIDGRPYLLLHGDELCIDDHTYQRARAVLRHPLFKPAVAPLPYIARIKVAQFLRRKSTAHKRTVTYNIMDVAPRAVEAMFAKFDAPTMIHGHTHRPATHTHGAHTRIVLADWQTYTQYGSLENGMFQSLPLE